MTARTLFDKIWQSHLVRDINESTGLLATDRILLHERTGGIALQSLAQANRVVRDPARVFVTMDHVVDTLPGRGDDTIMPTGKQFIVATRNAARDAGVTLFDLGDKRQGIVHVISPEQAIVLPGLTLVCPDSHTCTQGALGALAWGIGSSEAEHALATSTLRVARPDTMRITINGVLPGGVSAKDLALHIISKIGSVGARGSVVEYVGEAVRALDIEGRMTLCNMATELSAFTAIIAPDDITIQYLHERPYAPTGAAWQAAVADWSQLFSDPDAVFGREHVINAGDVSPMVSWGTSPQQSAPAGGPGAPLDCDEAARRAAAYMGLDPQMAVSGLPIDGAFIGSCTNARLSDLRRVAAVLDGRAVADGVRAICVPGSVAVKLMAEAEGLDRIIKGAGFEWREPGCSMCFFAGGESFAGRDRVISSTNRNFENRQGPGTRTHIASPETVAASAVMGVIGTVADLENGTAAMRDGVSA
jgi:3-isopropylmalate/(R)-2-methylmalate dehydratase large subunit